MKKMPGVRGFVARIMPTQPITQGYLLRVQTIGFSLVIVLLLAAAFAALENIRSVERSAGQLVEEQLVTTQLVDEVQRVHNILSSIFVHLEQGYNSEERDRILQQLDQAQTDLNQVANARDGRIDDSLWPQLTDAFSAFSREARRLLNEGDRQRIERGELFRRHEEMTSVVARLIGSSYQRAKAAEDQIELRSRGLTNHSLILLATSLCLAILTTVFTVRLTAGLFRKMEWQTGELSRISWQLLENQEATAKRFSHELHDEFGQSLTAVKSNLLAMRRNYDGDPQRMEDTVNLVQEAIRNVRQLSQLLRPTILDDFGLDAGIRSLCDGLTKRTSIEVNYKSNLERRLPTEMETHLFRIAQEALTNIARHSGATSVRVALTARNGSVRLLIEDNGKGMEPAGQWDSRGLGLVGMRARARSAGGNLHVWNEPGKGLAIQAEIPVREKTYEKSEQGVAG
jgi:signal transduction histidine kinase